MSISNDLSADLSLVLLLRDKDRVRSHSEPHTNLQFLSLVTNCLCTNSMNSCSCCWHSFCLLLLLLIHFVGGGILCFSDSSHLLYLEDSGFLVKQTRAPLEQWSSAVRLLSTFLNLAQWWVQVNKTKVLRKKGIISCSIMVNSRCPEQQSLINSPKILLLSHHLPGFKMWNLSSQWAGLFACFCTRNLPHVQCRSLLMLMSRTKVFSLFKSSSSFRAQVKSYLLYEILLTFLHPHLKNLFLFWRLFLWSSLSSLYDPAQSSILFIYSLVYISTLHLIIITRMMPFRELTTTKCFTYLFPLILTTPHEKNLLKFLQLERGRVRA